MVLTVGLTSPTAGRSPQEPSLDRADPIPPLPLRQCRRQPRPAIERTEWPGSGKVKRLLPFSGYSPSTQLIKELDRWNSAVDDLD